MKLIRCKNCKSWHSITKTSTCICWCSRSYFRLQEVGSDKVYIHGPCTVWTVPDKQFLKTPTRGPKPGMVIQMQWMKEPHKNINRVSLDKILFLEQYDPHAKKKPSIATEIKKGAIR